MASKLSAKHALELWRRSSLNLLEQGHSDLTQPQISLLLQVYLPPAPHTVRSLAAELHMSKPAVTRALDRLGSLDLVRRKTDEADRRSVNVQRTVKGAVFLRELGDFMEHKVVKL